MTNKLFTVNKKSILFNLIGFENSQYFDLAREIEDHGGKVSLLDEFNSEAMTIVNINNCFTVKFIKDSIENGSLADTENYYLKHLLENVTENDNIKNNSCDELSSTTAASEEDNVNDEPDMFSEDQCLEESPDLLNVENDVTDEETDQEVCDETNDTNLTALSETVVEEVGRQESPSYPSVNEINLEETPDDVAEDPAINEESPIITDQSDDDDIVPNSPDKTIRKSKNHNSTQRPRISRVDSSSSESSDALGIIRKRRKMMRLPVSRCASDVDLNDDSENVPRRSEKPLEKSEQPSKEKMIVMKKKAHVSSLPTSDEETVSFTHTEEIRSKKKTIRKKDLLNEELNEPKKSANNGLTKIFDFINEDNLQQKTAPDKTKSNTEETHRNNVKSNTDTKSSNNSDDRVNNPYTSSVAKSIHRIHAEWLNDHKNIGDMIKNKQGIKGSYYDKWEETGIFWWLIKNNKINVVGSEKTYKKLIAEGYLPHRTWKGIYNHFRRRMLKKLNIYNLPEDVYKQLKCYADSVESA